MKTATKKRSELNGMVFKRSEEEMICEGSL